MSLTRADGSIPNDDFAFLPEISGIIQQNTIEAISANLSVYCTRRIDSLPFVMEICIHCITTETLLIISKCSNVIEYFEEYFNDEV